MRPIIPDSVRAVLGALTFFHEIAFLLLAAAIAGILALRLRQPLVTIFIAVGLVAGPSVLGAVHPTEELQLLAEIGIALLLFVVGLKLDVRLVRAIGPGAVGAALVQMGLTGAAGYALGLAFGLDGLAAVYLGIALAISSTVVVVKLLSDRDEVDQLHGRLAVGILIVQDIAVIAAIIAMNAVGRGGDLVRELAVVAVEGVALVAVLAAAARWVLPPLLHRFADSQELLVLFAIAWALALAAVADLLGLSKEVGAFLAGVTLASSAYREAIGGRLASVRDFLLLFFFVNLGAALDVGALDLRLVSLAAICSVVVVLVKPAVTSLPLVLLGYRARPSLRTGIALAQVSEFSLILTAIGLGFGHVEQDLATGITVIAIATITASTYLARAGDAVARRLEPRLAPLQRTRVREHGAAGDDPDPEVIVVGLGRYGSGVVDGARTAGHEVLGVDHDPRRLAACADRGLHVVYGDAEDPDLPRRLPLRAARWVVSTLRRPEADLALVRALRRSGFEGRIAVASHAPEDMEVLADAGADLVLSPFVDAAAAATAAMFGEPATAQ